jgi:lambda repressor-like predicted transcriptional regulator
MNHHQRAAIERKGLSVKALGQLLDRHPSHVSSVLSAKSKRFRSPILRFRIAKILGEPVEYLWPDSGP